MNSNIIHHKYSNTNTNKLAKDIKSSTKENSLNTYYNANTIKNIKLNILPHSLSSNKNVIVQP